MGAPFCLPALVLLFRGDSILCVGASPLHPHDLCAANSLVQSLSDWRGYWQLSLGYKDLFHMGLFRCQKDIEDFLSFYSVLSCLEPPVVDSSGLTTDAQLEPESKKIVKEISEMLQLKKPKLKDVARDAELRRIGSEAHLGALGLGQSFSLHRLNLLRTGSKGGSHGQCGAWGGGGVFDYDANHHHPPLAQP
eukprot:1884773-Rhodomonas_salina.1